MLNRSEINRALSKAIAYKNCDKQKEAEYWGIELVRQLECAGLLPDGSADLIANDLTDIYSVSDN